MRFVPNDFIQAIFTAIQLFSFFSEIYCYQIARKTPFRGSEVLTCNRIPLLSRSLRLALCAPACACVSWNLQLQFFILFINITGWLIGIIRTKSSRSHLPKQARTLLLSPQSGHRTTVMNPNQSNNDAGYNTDTNQPFYYHSDIL